MGKIKCKYQKGHKMIVDIELSETATKIKFPEVDSAGNKIEGISLMDCNKVFQSVKTIAYADDLLKVEIPNTMFPNVKNVISGDKIFHNAFYSDESTVFDLEKYTKIGEKAFWGCKTTNLINTENIVSCAADAFKNSAFEQKPFENGLKIAGTIVYDVDTTQDVIDIPDYITCIAVPEKFSGLNKVIIHSLTPKYMSCIAGVFSAEEVILGKEINDKEFKSGLDKFWFKKCKKITLSENIKNYIEKDNLIYNAAGDCIVLCPAYITGELTIPDGIKRIKKNAFLHSKIKSVILPNSIFIIDNEAFSYCKNLESIICDYEIPSTAFKKCKNLKMETKEYVA